MNTELKKEARYVVRFQQRGRWKYVRNHKNPDQIAIFNEKDAEAVADRITSGKAINLDTLNGVGLLMKT